MLRVRTESLCSDSAVMNHALESISSHDDAPIRVFLSLCLSLFYSFYPCIYAMFSRNVTLNHSCATVVESSRQSLLVYAISNDVCAVSIYSVMFL